MTGIAFLNGAWVPEDQASISIRDRGLLLGDGVFETARLHRGQYFRLGQHLARLEVSAGIMRLELPALDRLRDIALELAARNRYPEASLRITVTRGPGGRGLHAAGAGPPTIMATLSPIAADWEERAARGWRLLTASVRRPAAVSVPPELKGLGRTYALLAHFEAEAAGYDDALLLSADGYIAEGPTWNVFWRRGNTVFTPASGADILAGLTRAIMLDLARDAGYSIQEGLWPRAALDDADEAFATMTSNGVVPIRELDHRSFPHCDAAGILQVEYWKLVRRELGQTE